MWIKLRDMHGSEVILNTYAIQTIREAVVSGGTWSVHTNDSVISLDAVTAASLVRVIGAREIRALVEVREELHEYD